MKITTKHILLHKLVQTIVQKFVYPNGIDSQTNKKQLVEILTIVINKYSH